MALQGFPALKIEIDASVGGALTDISAYVMEINGYAVEQVLEELTSAGDASDRWAAVGFEQKSEIVLTGPYDDQANSLVALTLDGEGELRTLKLTFDDPGASDTRQVETLIKSTSRNPKRGAFHAYVLTLRPTGAVT
jgi:hypothetical protein